jgi:hypothetical protein
MAVTKQKETAEAHDRVNRKPSRLVSGRSRR